MALNYLDYCPKQPFWFYGVFFFGGGGFWKNWQVLFGLRLPYPHQKVTSPFMNSQTLYLQTVDYSLCKINEQMWLFPMLISLQEWTDERLTWDPQKYSNLSDIVVSAGRIWLPELAVINGCVWFTLPVFHLAFVIVLRIHVVKFLMSPFSPDFLHCMAGIFK